MACTPCDCGDVRAVGELQGGRDLSPAMCVRELRECLACHWGGLVSAVLHLGGQKPPWGRGEAWETLAHARKQEVHNGFRLQLENENKPDITQLKYGYRKCG